MAARDDQGRFVKGSGVSPKPGINVQVDQTNEAVKLLEKLQKVLTPGEIFGLVLRLFDKLALKAAGFISQTTLSGQLLKRRTGQLAAAMTGRAVLVAGIPSIRVGIFKGPALAYAAAQELGAEIVPKKGRALAIPLEPVLTPAGVERIQGPTKYEEYFGAKLVFIPFRRGIAVGALYDERELRKLKGPKAGRLSLRDIQAAYLLVTRVDVPAKHYMRTGMLNYIPYIVKELLQLFRGLVTNAGLQ